MIELNDTIYLGKAKSSSGADLSDYYTKSETDTALSGKADKATTLAGYGITNAYTKTEVDNIASAKANVGLDNLSAAGQMIVDSVNGTISNCVLEIPQNIKLKLKDNVLTLKAGSIITLAGNTYATHTVSRNHILTISSDLLNGKYYINSTVSSDLLITAIDKFKSGSELPSTASAGDRFYKIDDKTFWFYNGEQWTASGVFYPICLIEVNDGVASFAKDSNGNDMIFNGAGFIGHHAFVLPGVKALAANGLNTDGSMKSISITTNSLDIIDIHSGHYIIRQGNQPNIAAITTYIDEVNNYDDIPQPMQVWHRYYVKSENKWYVYVTNVENFYTLELVKYTTVNNIVTDFTIRQPVRTATVEMMNKALGDVETLLANI